MEDIQVFAIPCYHKHKIRYRPEVADLRDNIKVHRQKHDGSWFDLQYMYVPNDSFMEYDTAVEALQMAQEYADKLRNE